MTHCLCGGQKDCFEVYALLPGLLREEVLFFLFFRSCIIVNADVAVVIREMGWSGSGSVGSGGAFGDNRSARAGGQSVGHYSFPKSEPSFVFWFVCFFLCLNKITEVIGGTSGGELAGPNRSASYFGCRQSSRPTLCQSTLRTRAPLTIRLCSI